MNSGLRPLYGLEVLDEAFAVMRERAWSLFGVAAVAVVPVQLLIAYSQRDLFQGRSIATVMGNPTSLNSASGSGAGTQIAASFVGTLGGWVGLAVVGAVSGRMVAAHYSGRRITASQAASMPVRAWASVLVACVFVHLCEAVGLIGLGVGALFPMCVFAAVSPIIAVEGSGPFAAMGRSWTLSMRRFGAVVGPVLAFTWVAVVMHAALESLPTYGAALIGFGSGWLLYSVGTIGATLVTYAACGVFASVLYLNLRTWTEGTDLSIALSSLHA